MVAANQLLGATTSSVQSRGTPLKFGLFLTENCNTCETGQDRTEVTIDDQQEVAYALRLVPKSTTLDDLEVPIRTVSSFRMLRTSSGPQEIRQTLLYSIIQSLVTFPLTSKYLSLNGRFMFSFHYHEPRSAITLHIYRRAIYRIFLLHDVTSGDVRKRTVKTVIRRILRIRKRIADLSQKKRCQRHIVGTLTNQASIIIQYYLVRYRLSTDSNTRDLEWP